MGIKTPANRRAIARARQDGDQWTEQPLAAHLHGVARLAQVFSSGFGAAELGYLAGLWHDLGKYAADFQRYIREVTGFEAENAHLENESTADGKRRVDHSSAGALHAIEILGSPGLILAQLIAAHHTGLQNANDLRHRLGRPDTRARLPAAISGGAPPEILDAGKVPPAFNKPAIADRTPGAYALWLRMLFSALVDADVLDSERFMEEGRAHTRADFPALDSLRPDFDAHMARFSPREDAPLADETSQRNAVVQAIRAEILADCRTAALHPTGLFTLTVPTGGGKTLSSLAFAIDHAIRHGLKRVIYVIPYTSIIEQTANVFRSISPAFAGAVIEHHSNADDAHETARSRLATENWDAPVVVTTSVQFFESLFAAKTSRCRKLHSICESVVILDEAQLLPPAFLQPIVDVLNLLTRHYRTSIVLSTATQPALASKSWFGSRFRGLDDSREIVSDVERLYRQLKRVDVHMPADFAERRTWPEIAEALAGHEDVLAIVNRRAEARELHGLLPKGTLHLSALMCGAHRSDVIATIKQRLAERRADAGLPPVRVVSTQLVEAGVDLDFPVVYRAFAGLDSIAQAAGRCNREGRLERGHVYVFIGEKDAPAGLLRMAEAAAKEVLHEHRGDVLDRTLYEPYFTQVYRGCNLDEKEIVAKLAVDRETMGVVGLRDAADDFKLIDNDETGYQSVFVPYRRNDDDHEFETFIAQLRKEGPARWLMRKLQRYSVSLPPHEFRALHQKRDIEEVLPGFWVLRSSAQYGQVLGLIINAGQFDVQPMVL